MKLCYIIRRLLGEWLNGRVAVSKTVGCVFESRLPCHGSQITIIRGLRVFLYKKMQTFYDSCLFILYQQSEQVNQTKNATLILSIRKEKPLRFLFFVGLRYR